LAVSHAGKSEWGKKKRDSDDLEGAGRRGRKSWEPFGVVGWGLQPRVPERVIKMLHYFLKKKSRKTRLHRLATQGKGKSKFSTNLFKYIGGRLGGGRSENLQVAGKITVRLFKQTTRRAFEAIATRDVDKPEKKRRWKRYHVHRTREHRKKGGTWQLLVSMKKEPEVGNIRDVDGFVARTNSWGKKETWKKWSWCWWGGVGGGACSHPKTAQKTQKGV